MSAKTLEARLYVATTEDIDALVRGYLGAISVHGSTRSTYLRALIATTQAQLASPPKTRTYVRNIEGALITEQVSALETVHKKFYDVVLKAIEDSPPVDGMTAHARSGFARSAKSTIRSWIMTGHDITGLAAGRVTKSFLREGVPVRQGRPRQQNHISTKLKSVTDAADTLASTDKAAAMKYLEDAMTVLATKLISLGGQTTTKIAESAKDHRPLRRGNVVYWPTLAAETTQ